MRQGNKADWHPEKMLSAEMAVIKDKKELHFAYADGKTKRVATEDDISELSEQIEELEESGIGGSGGQPIVVKTASAMTDTTAIYLYMGEGETVNGVVYEYGYIYTYDTDTSTWANSGLYGKGQDGHNGSDGEDGFSPTVTATETETGVSITVTDKDGSKSVEVKNGTDGKDGADGKDGENGTATDEQVNKYVSLWLEEHLEVTIEDGSITYDKLAEEVKMKVLPAVAEADNGKILQVVNGEWALVEPNFGGADLTEIAELVGGDA